MNQIESLTETFIQGKSLNVTSSGKWYIESKVVRSLRHLFKCDDRRVTNVTYGFTKMLDQLEQTAVRFDHKNEVDYSSYLKFGLALQSKIVTKEALQALNISLVGLKYRIEKINGGLDRGQSDERAFNSVISEAEKWKSQTTLYQSKELSENERLRLDELKHYPEFLTLITNNNRLRNDFFKWSLRDNNGVRQFIEFPATCKKLKTHLLSGRIGRFGPETLGLIDRKHSKKGGSKKVLTLPFEGLKKNILNEKKVIHFRGDYDLSVKQVFKTFQDKNKRVGNLEFFGVNGISNWNVHKLGWWDGKEHQMVNLDDEKWWEKLPVFEELDKTEVMNRFSLDALDEGEWVVGAKGSSEFIEVDFDRSHGYIGLAIPMENGMYRYMSMGKFAEKFPVKDISKLYMLSSTVRAKISYPDENEFYSHRRQAISPIKISSKEAEGIMESIKKDLVQAREGNIVFQLAWENCAFWPQMLLSSLKDHNVPEYYKAHLTDCFPHQQPMRWLFDAYRKSPKWLQTVMLHIVLTALLFFRGVFVKENGKLTYRTLFRSPFHKTLELYYPSRQHEKILAKEIPGKVTFGHMELLA